MKIAVIPARGGSKRIPLKNIRPFAGKPMIGHAIDIAHNAGIFDKIIVSTDDAEIARIAEEFGALVPFIRPAALADDHIGTTPVIRHAIDECEKLGWKLGYVCGLYCCVPLLEPSDLRGAFELNMRHQDKFIFPVVRFPSAIQRALRLKADDIVEPIWPENIGWRSQDLEPTYYDAGQFYFARPDIWRENDHIHASGIAIELMRDQVVDIDTIDDWEHAELLWKLREKSKA